MASESSDVEIQDIGSLTARVMFDLPFFLNLEDGPYQVSRGGWTALVNLECIKQDHLDPRLGISQSSANLIRDRHGRLHYSRVVVELPGKDVIESELRRQAATGNIESKGGIIQVRLTQDAIVSDYSEAAFKEALTAVNRLIEVYRLVANEFHVTRIPAGDIFNVDSQWHHNGEPFGGIWQLGFGHGINIQPPPLSLDTLQKLHSWLGTTELVPLPWELFQDAQDRLDRNDDRQAVIDARTALEVFLDQILLTYFTCSGLPLEEVGEVLGLDVKRLNIQEVEEALQRSQINRKLGHALIIAIGLDIHNGSPQLWKRWLEAKELREKGVHRGRSVEHHEAVEAVNCLGEILSEMRQALSKVAWFHDQIDSKNDAS